MLVRVSSSARERAGPRRGENRNRCLPGGSTRFEHIGAFLVADGVAEDAPEQADVVAQPGVLFQRLHVSGPFGLSQRRKA